MDYVWLSLISDLTNEAKLHDHELEMSSVFTSLHNCFQNCASVNEDNLAGILKRSIMVI